MLNEKIEKLEAKVLSNEEENGMELVQVVIILGVAVILGAILLVMAGPGGPLQEAFNSVGNQVSNMSGQIKGSTS